MSIKRFPPDACLEPAEAWQNVAPSIWVSINQSVAKLQPVNLGQGFPDFDPPENVTKNLADVALDSNKLLHQYTRSMGHLRLTEVLAKLYQPFLECNESPNNLEVEVLKATFFPEHALDPLNNIIISVGGYGSLFAAFSALINSGDECIIMEPNFDCYGPMTIQAGGIPIYVQLRPKVGKIYNIILFHQSEKSTSSSEWVLDMNQMESVVSARTRVLVLNTPHNPLGKVFSLEELKSIASFCVKHNLLCISDEVYEWIVFGDNNDKHIKIASLPGMWGRTVTIGSAGKTFSVTGWKLGWTIGPRKLIQAMQSQQQNTIFACPTIIQEAVARSLEDEFQKILQMDQSKLEKECYLRSLRHKLKMKSDKMLVSLEKAGMRPTVPQSGYFLITDISNLDIPADFNKDNEFIDIKTNDWLMQTKKICGIPLSVFYNSPATKKFGQRYIRWCFAKKEETLEKAIKILNDF